MEFLQVFNLAILSYSQNSQKFDACEKYVFYSTFSVALCHAVSFCLLCHCSRCLYSLVYLVDKLVLCSFKLFCFLVHKKFWKCNLQGYGLKTMILVSRGFTNKNAILVLIFVLNSLVLILVLRQVSRPENAVLVSILVLNSLVSILVLRQVSRPENAVLVSILVLNSLILVSNCVILLLVCLLGLDALNIKFKI